MLRPYRKTTNDNLDMINVITSALFREHQMFSSKPSDVSSVSSVRSSGKNKRSSTFRIVPKRESMVLPDKGYDKGWIRLQAERDATAAEGEGWRSKAYAFSIVQLVRRQFPNINLLVAFPLNPPRLNGG